MTPRRTIHGGYPLPVHSPNQEGHSLLSTSKEMETDMKLCTSIALPKVKLLAPCQKSLPGKLGARFWSFSATTSRHRAEFDGIPKGVML